MTNTKDIIMKLKEVRAERGLSYQDIMNLMEKNGDYTSKATLSRLFAEGSENYHFKYDETIRPVANALLDIDHIEDDDTMDVQAMKSLLKVKREKIEDLEKQLAKIETQLANEKIKYHKKLDKEREQYERKIEFLKNQITLKDERIDKLMESVIKKDGSIGELLKQLLNRLE